MDINLKPCPFCGKEPVVDSQINEYGDLEFSVMCVNDSCFVEVQTRYMSFRETVYAWNRRADDEAD